GGSWEGRGARFAAWLIRIAANTVADRFKRVQREVPVADSPEETINQPDLEAVERRARLFREVNQLPTDQRTVIIERFVEERSIRDIAHQLGKSEGAVKQ